MAVTPRANLGTGPGWVTMADSVGTLKDTVNSGTLHMTQDAADKLVNGMKGLQATLNRVVAKADLVSREPLIGDTEKCQVYRPFLASVATDPNQGLLPQIYRMQKDSQDIIDNIHKCVADLQATEGENRRPFDSE
jgi:hypothetical protein